MMKVSELAKELEVPPSAVLEQCQRFGIDAGWAGAELSGTDVVILRAELAGVDEPLDLTPADAPPTDEPASDEPAMDEPAAGDPPSEEPATDEPAADEVAATAGAGAAGLAAGRSLPPTAVGSMPELIDEVTPEPEPDPGPNADGGTKFAGSRPGVDATVGPRRIPPRQPPEKRRFDVAVRNTAGALVVGLVAFGASNLVDNPFLVVALWVLTVAALLVALFQANRARVHITTHPERLRGLWLTGAMALVAALGLIAIGLGTYVALGDAPAADAPAGLGDLQSVQVARWARLRTSRIADNDWKRPAKDAGTCWGVDAKHLREVPERVESETHSVSCDDVHTEEVPVVFAVNRDADAPYPGVDQLLIAARKECSALVRKIGTTKAGKGVAIRLGAEYPTATGWEEGDHDVACVLITAPRKGELAP